MTDVSAKTVLVIGGTGGIGRAVVSLLAEKGHTVYATYFTKREAAEERGADRVNWMQCDVRSEDSVAQLFETITKNGDTVDVLINASARPLVLKPVTDLTLGDYQEDIDHYLMGAVRVTKHAAAAMKEEGGLIIHLLSRVIESTPPRMSSYTAAKCAVWGFIRSVSDELKRSGIAVIGISPSFVETEMLTAFPAKLLELERAKQRSGTFLEPQTIAEAVATIIAHREHYSGGEIIPIEGVEDVENL